MRNAIRIDTSGDETYPPEEFLRIPGFQVLTSEELDTDSSYSLDDIAEAMELAGCTPEQIDTALHVLGDPDHWISRVSEALMH